MAKRVMKLIDIYKGRMECKVCGSYHDASIKPRSNGRFHYGSWQCVHKCKLPTATESQAYNGCSQKWIDANEMYIPSLKRD